jgi:hypothetical protein
MYSIAAEFSRARVGFAVLVTMLETLGIWPFVSVIATLTLALVVPGFAMVAIVAQALFIAIFVLAYCVSLREMRRALLILPTNRVSYQLSEEGCAISSDALSEFLPWRSFLRVTHYPSMVLLEIIQRSSREDLLELLRARLRTMPLQAALRRQARGFPVFWMRPMPLRTFLVIPATGMPEEQIAFIRDRLGSAGRI